MTLSTIFPKQLNPVNFIQETTSFLFDSEKRNEVMLNDAIKSSDKCLELLINFLENIDENDVSKEDEQINDSLDLFKLLHGLLSTLCESIGKTVNESEQNNDPLFYKYRALFNKNKEIVSTLDKIVFRINDLKDNKVTSIMSSLSISANNDLWTDDEDRELMELFLKS